MQKHHSIIPLEIENKSLNSKKSRYTYLNPHARTLGTTINETMQAIGY